MKKIKIILFMLLMICLSANITFAADKSDLIREYLSVSGFLASYSDLIELQTDIMIQNIKGENRVDKELEQDIREVWAQLMKEYFWTPGGLFDSLKPIFKPLSRKDLRQIIKFYSTPAGRKMAEMAKKLPLFLEKSMPKIEKNLQKIFVPEFKKRIKARGWINKNGKIIKR